MAPATDLLRELNSAAEAYVRLVLSVGHHDADYVDAYYGPEELKREVDREKPSLGMIRERAEGLRGTLRGLRPDGAEPMLQLRHTYLSRQLEALHARTLMLSGSRFTFDEESKALYDAVAPVLPESYFQGIIGELDGLLPGRGSVPDRFEAYKREFVIPKEKLDVVFQAAIAEARLRTKHHVDLPGDERFTIEYVTGKSWSGYNWYKGGSTSLIQINTDLPVYIDRAVDLASHEGYPGHHVYNLLLEKHLVRERRWLEFTVYPLFSPQSLIAEGTANYGIAMAFPGDERSTFERGVLFPRAGMEPGKAAEYYRIHELFLKLNYAGNEAARGYLDGAIDRQEAIRWLIEYGLFSPARAAQRTRFFDQYRSYVINYNLGQDLVGRYIESRGGTTEHPAKRWKEFTALLASPRLPSGLLPS